MRTDKQREAVLRYNYPARIDWRKIDIAIAQQLYARLQTEYRIAGEILNDRTTPKDSTYTCYVCKKVHPRPAKGIDNAHRHPETGLMEIVEVCGERCWIIYWQQQQDEKRARERELTEQRE